MRYIAVHNIELTPTLQENILSYHAVTECDTVSQLSGQGEKQHGRYSRSTVHCSMTLDMAHFQNPQYRVWTSSSVEYYRQVLMKQTSTTSVTVCFNQGNQGAREASSNSEESRTTQNFNRAHYQAKVCIWQIDVPLPDFESQVGSGWYEKSTTGNLHRQLSVDNLLPKEFTDILYCKCKHCTTARCSCRAKNLKCTGACACQNGICHNPYSVVIESDSD